MTTILRPTRGGESSFPNQDRAIAIAKERDADLLLLYVSNVHFLDHVAGPVLVDVETELDEMGEFLLAMAQERAEKAGVRAETIVRRGEFREALEQVIQEHGEITTLLLGAAVEETSVIPAGYLEEMAKSLVVEYGIEVIIVHEGQIVEHYTP